MTQRPVLVSETAKEAKIKEKVEISIRGNFHAFNYKNKPKIIIALVCDFWLVFINEEVDR